MSGLPPLNAPTTRAPGMWSFWDASFSIFVNAVTWEVSSPIIPILRSAADDVRQAMVSARETAVGVGIPY